NPARLHRVDQEPRGVGNLVQMADLNAGDAIEPVKLGRFKARLAVENDVLLADEDGIAEAKLADRRCDLSHMGRVELADLLGRRSKLVDWQVSQLEMRKDVIAPRAGRGRCGGKPAQTFAPPSTFGLQLIGKRPRAFNFLVTTIGQDLLHRTA